MEFTLIEERPKMNGKIYRLKGGTVQIADWLKEAYNPNEIDDKIDSFFDAFGDLCLGDDGKLYLVEGGIWCEIANQNEEIAKLNPIKSMTE